MFLFLKKKKQRKRVTRTDSFPGRIVNLRLPKKTQAPTLALYTDSLYTY